MSGPKAMPALLAFQVNGMRPFETSATDLAQTSLAQAHALATMLGCAFGDTPETGDTNSEIIGSAFGGIARLVALAAISIEEA